MKEYPILFSGPMVRAILEGRKTQTRRPVNPQPEYRENYSLPGRYGTFGKGGWNLDDPIGKKCFVKTCPYGQPRDRLWVRETFLIDHAVYYKGPLPKEKPDLEGCPILYRADGSCCEQYGECEFGGKPFWRPSIHMPRWASRIMLSVSGVRLERLRDTSISDCHAEGYAEKSNSDPVDQLYDRVQFALSWDRTYACLGWDKNPWVWVIEFTPQAAR